MLQQLPGLHWRWRLLAMAMGCLIGVVALLNQGQIGPLRQLETTSLDWRFRLRGPRPPPPDMVLLVIDNATINTLGGWPLPRIALAKAIEQLDKAGARVIALDLLLAESNRTADGELSPSDAQLRDAMIDASPLVLPIAFGFMRDALLDNALPDILEKNAYNIVLADDASTGPPQASQALLPAPPFLSAASKLGHVSLALAEDGILRSDLPVISLEGDFFPSFSVAAVSAFLGLAPGDVVLELDRGVRLGSRLVPFDRHYRHFLNYYGGRRAFQRHSLIELLELRIPRELFAGRFVLIGVDALGVGDRFPTPFATNLSGVEYLATSAANMIDGSSLHRGRQQVLVDIVVIVLGAVLAAAVSARGRPLLTMVSNGLLLLLVAAWCQAWFVAADWWLSFAFPVTAIIVTAFVTEFARTIYGIGVTRQLERDRATLARHFAPEIVEEILERDYRAQLDRSISAAIVFIDLAGFTTLCEAMRPNEAIAFLREYHRLVETAVFRHRGMIANFAGDGVMCCFGVPETRESSARDAVLAACQLARSVHRWRHEIAVRRHRQIGVGVGVHFGSVLIGNVGGERQLQYTAIGDTVNIASRLQALTRERGKHVLISGEAMQRARLAAPEEELGETFEPLGPISLRGRKEPIEVWGWSDEQTNPTIPD